MNRGLSPSPVREAPAARAGARPGDIIPSVNGTPPFTDGMRRHWKLSSRLPRMSVLLATIFVSAGSEA
jgi:S1-C subfamily serine protease